MDACFPLLNRRDYPVPSYYYSSPPSSAYPIVDRPSLWDDDQLTQYTSLRNPNHSIEALMSRFSSLYFDGNPGSSNNPAAGVNASPRLQVVESRSALPWNLIDQGTNPVFGNQSADVYGSSPYTPSSSSSNMLSRGSFGSFGSFSPSFFGGEMSSGIMGRTAPCGDYCSCQHNYPPNQFYQQPQQLDHHGHNFMANVPNGPRRLSSGFTDDVMCMNNRRVYQQNLELESSKVNLMDLRGNFLPWVTDPNLCRVLQAKFQHPSREEIEMVLSEVIDHASDLMMHSCGHYFMQMLIDVCDEEQRSRLLFSVINDSVRLKSVCCNNHGTRCIQRLLENFQSPNIISQFIGAITPSVIALIKDMNGYHVIQYCLNNFSPQQNKNILWEVVLNCFDLARDISGCRVIQQCVDSSEGEDRLNLLSEIIDCALLLSEDRYGNYVVQHVLELKNAEINSRIQTRLTGNFASLARNKFGSHVVEKCITLSDFYHSSLIIKELMQTPMLLNDPFGNFVMQAALSYAQGHTLRLLCKLIEERRPTMQSNMYGRKLLEAYNKKKAPACVNMYYHQSLQ